MIAQDLPCLDVAIIGGGIAGALAARVLREQHNVTIYERSKSASEIGAAINVGPNGVKILDQLGFSRELVGSLTVGRMATYNHHGEALNVALRDFKRDFGADWLFQHRADLHQEFIRLATVDSEELGIAGQPARIHYGATVVQAEPESGTITLADGTDRTFDLLVGADGIKSVLRPRIIGKDEYTTARPSGQSAFRFTLQKSYIEESLAYLPAMIDSNEPVTLTVILALDGSKRTMVAYPCRNMELLNFVCIVRDKDLANETTESWTAEGDKEELLALFSGFPGWALELVRLAGTIKLWQLRDQDPLPTYVKGRSVLIGDAAHAMTPHQGQGGTQAIEDAEGFRLFLGPKATTSHVPAILEDFDSVRRPRASQIQNNTRMAAARKSAEDIYRFEQFNWNYPGIMVALNPAQGSN